MMENQLNDIAIIYNAGMKIKRLSKFTGDNKIENKYGNRGVIKGMSANSRRRLMDILMKIDWDSITNNDIGIKYRGFFVTLTYPKEYVNDRKVYKKHLKAMIMRLRRKYDEIALIWKLEYQKRGAPHYHILLYIKNGAKLDDIRAWISLNWYQVVKSNDYKHYKAGTNVKPIIGNNTRLMRYLGKYIGKIYETVNETGRVWGVWGIMPMGKIVIMIIKDWVEIIRRIRKWGKKSKYLHNLKWTVSVTLYGNTSEQLLRGLTVTI